MLSKCKYSNKKQKHREKRQKNSNNTTNHTDHQIVTTHTKNPPHTALHHIITPFPHIKQQLCPTDGRKHLLSGLGLMWCVALYILQKRLFKAHFYIAATLTQYMYNTCTIFVRLQLYIYCTSIVHILYNDQCWYGENIGRLAGELSSVLKKNNKKIQQKNVDCQKRCIFALGNRIQIIN